MVNLPPNIYNQTELIIIPSSSVQGDSHILADGIVNLFSFIDEFSP